MIMLVSFKLLSTMQLLMIMQLRSVDELLGTDIAFVNEFLFLLFLFLFCHEQGKVLWFLFMSGRGSPFVVVAACLRHDDRVYSMPTLIYN